MKLSSGNKKVHYAGSGVKFVVVDLGLKNSILKMIRIESFCDISISLFIDCFIYYY